MTIPQRVLVIRLSAMGDVAMCVPVLLAINRDYPDVQFITLSRKRFNNILQQIPQTICVEADVQGEHKGVTGIYKLTSSLQDYHIQAVADLHNVLRSKIIRMMLPSIAKAAINKGRDAKNKLILSPSHFKELPHTTTRYAAVFEQLGFQVNLNGLEYLPALPLPNFEPLKKKSEKWIGFAPFAAHQTKAFSLEKAREVLEQLAIIPDVTVILYGGGAEETAMLDTLASNKENIISLASKINFNQELATISHLDLMISMDSGNGHLAAMYGIPVITIWGNTHYYAGFAPYSQPLENQIVVDRKAYPKVPTSIFGNKKVPGYENITNTVETATIIGRALAILKESR